MTESERLALLESIGREILDAQDALNAAGHMWDVQREAHRRNAALLELRTVLASSSTPDEAPR